MEKSRVLGLGLATIDQYVVLPAFPEPNQKYRSDEWYSSGGGNCANTLVALSRLGVQTELITLVGNDYEGRQILSGLEKENVSTKNVDSTAQRSSLSFVIIDKNKDTRTIINRPGPDYSTDISFNPSAIKGASMVYLDGRFQKSAKRLASLAVARDIPVTLDVERIGLFS
jgi:sugar/nucleoside kinase (ribokinase family)